LPIRAFLENPAKCPDPIRALFKPEIPKRAQSDIIKTGVMSPDKNGLIKMVRVQNNCPQNRIKVHWKAF
jgi:hypothetical protein